MARRQSSGAECPRYEKVAGAVNGDLAGPFRSESGGTCR